MRQAQLTDRFAQHDLLLVRLLAELGCCEATLARGFLLRIAHEGEHLADLLLREALLGQGGESSVVRVQALLRSRADLVGVL